MGSIPIVSTIDRESFIESWYDMMAVVADETCCRSIFVTAEDFYEQDSLRLRAEVD